MSEQNPAEGQPQQQQTEVHVDDSGGAAVLLELLPGHGHARGGDPRLRPESPAVRHRPPGRQGEPADRDELLHGQAAPDGPGHDDPAARGDLRLDRAGRPPPGRRPARPAADRPPGRGRVSRPTRADRRRGVSGPIGRPGTPFRVAPALRSVTTASTRISRLSVISRPIFSDPDDYDERFRDAGRAGRAETPDDSAQRGPPVAPIPDDAGHLGLGSGWTSLGLGDDGMSHPSRPRASGPDQRRPRGARIEAIESLEQRQLLAPVVAVQPRSRRPSPPFADQPRRHEPGHGHLHQRHLPSQTGATNALTAFPEAAAITSVSELTTNHLLRRRHRPDPRRARRRVRQRRLRRSREGPATTPPRARSTGRA